MSASVSVPNLSTQEASELMDSIVTGGISRAPAVENVNITTQDEGKQSALDSDMPGGEMGI